MSIRAFLSFQYEDITLVNAFHAMACVEANDLEFDDYSVKQAFSSNDVDYICRKIREKIKYSTLTVCLYGSNTYSSEWVDWELRETVRQEKPIMGVNISNNAYTFAPSALFGWPTVRWNASEIVSTMNRLAALYRNNYRIFNAAEYF